MNICTRQRVLLTVSMLLAANFTAFAIPPKMRDLGFVYLHEVDPTIITSLRYYSNDNFVGKPVDGYKKNVAIMTRQAAQALKRVQTAVNKDGYSLVVYDAYRPQQAVDQFMRWSKDLEDQAKKSEYYPRVNKANVFDLGYVAQRSGHSRGSTVDVTLIELGKKPHAIEKTKRLLPTDSPSKDDFTITFLDDGTVDMGSSFDLFDLASHYYENKTIHARYRPLRKYLKEAMEAQGFKVLAEEWWHFTLNNEPFPADKDSSYFNFPIE